MTRISRKSDAQAGQGANERFIYQDDVVIEKSFDWAVFRRLGVFIKPYTIQLLPVMAMTFLSTLTKLCIPILLAWTIDRAIIVGDTSKLGIYAGTIMLLYIVQWIANTYRIKHMNEIGQKVIYDIRAALFKHIQRLSFRFFDQRPAGSVLVRVTNDVNSLQDLFTNGLVNVMVDLVQLVGIVIILLFLNVQLALAVMITVPLMFLISTAFRKRVRRAWQDVRIKQSRINSHLNESIQGIRVTQGYTQEKENIGFFDHMNEENRKSWNRAVFFNQGFGPMTEITAGIGMCILFWYGTHMVQNGMSIGILFAFATYIGNFWEPINRLGQMYAQLLVAMASSERIFEFMDEQPSVGERPDARELPPVVGHVKLDNVVFAYEADRPALKGISLEVQPGQSIALVGHTGSGKSTIMNLITRFYDPVQGRVLIDGHDVRDVTLESLRSQIGVVLQDTFIFSGTIRDNIRYGRLSATDAEVEMAARAVHADEFIRAMPNGYDTEVEERGNVLSMGQRQLISFARALLADPKILILDEATASIDTETEMKIQLAMKTLLSGRTSFIVAHRLSTIRNADKIVVLDHGQVMEMGNHDELMRRRGVYNGLIEAQYRFLNESVS